MLDEVLQAYGFDLNKFNVRPFGSGLINSTWKLTQAGTDHSFILQKINHQVFKKPEDIAYNVREIGQYLLNTYPDYLFVRNVLTSDGKDLVSMKGSGYYRVVPFVKNSHTVDVLETPAQAYEAARQFGRFTYLLRDFPVDTLKVTIPDFHNLSLRYDQFLEAVVKGNPERIRKAAVLIDWLKKQAFIVDRFNNMRVNPLFKLRVTHHDTKISNVLFDDHDKGLCVIDLDTVMPGYFISDVGDMMRTCLSPVSEEETDFTKIEIRTDYYKAIATGYLEALQNELTDAEKACFFDAGCYLIYMQALRFLADHLNNDSYYGARYEGHNYNRAGNQVVLLQKMFEKESALRAITAS